MTVEMINNLSLVLATVALFFVFLSFFLFLHFQLQKTFRFAFMKKKKKAKQNVNKMQSLDTVLLETVKLQQEETKTEEEFTILQEISFLEKNQ